jgi:DNA polymerase-3 subunit beta
MNGVLWEKSAKRLHLVATDGRRLARAGGGLLASSSGDFQAIVPSKALGVFEKVFTRPKDEADWRVDVKLLPNQMMFRSGGKVLSTILVEGHFPQYQGVVPRDNDRKARLPRDEFHAAIRRAALLTNEQSRAVRFSFKDDTLVMMSQSPEQGEATVHLRVAYEGAPLEIGFNPGFLADALRVMPYEEVTLELKEAARPGILSGGDKDEYYYVVMPVSL